MATWKDIVPRKDAPANDPGLRADAAPLDPVPAPEARRPVAHSGAGSESVIAAGITIDGKIEGSGHVRVAGNFKGDIHVEGDLTIEAGAKVTGGVRAVTVTVAGELNGNIEAASRVDLRETGVLTGDLKAGSLTVAAGSRMRGQAEFGWDEKGTGTVQAPRDSFAVA